MRYGVRRIAAAPPRPNAIACPSTTPATHEMIHHAAADTAIHPYVLIEGLYALRRANATAGSKRRRSASDNAASDSVPNAIMRPSTIPATHAIVHHAAAATAIQLVVVMGATLRPEPVEMGLVVVVPV